MKKLLAFVLAAVMVLALVPMTAMAVTDFTDTGATTYTINNNDDLLAFVAAANGGNNFEGKKIVLANNLNLGGMEWTPISSFAGEFDGNGKTISNFKITLTGNQSGGFFKNIEAGSGERVHDLTLSDVTASVEKGRFGTLANNIKGIVNRVTVKNVTVTTGNTAAWVGGMCAFMSWPWMNDCTVQNLTVNAANGADLIGGFACILQKNSNMVFDNLDVKGFKVTVADADSSGCGVAGFVGQTQRGWEYPEVKNCDISGIDITASGLVDVGGFIAWPGAHTTAKNCTTQGKIDVAGVTSDKCFAGGFFGNLGWNADLGRQGHKVSNCSANVDITTRMAPAGGFIGAASNSNNASMYGEFTNCVANGDVTCVNGGTASVGGFAGVSDRGHYDGCTATGNVSGPIAGGFIGEVLDVTPKYDGRYPAGTRSYPANEVMLDTCTATGDVYGAQYAGGLIGYVNEKTSSNDPSKGADGMLILKNNLARGKVTGDGLVDDLMNNADSTKYSVVESADNAHLPNDSAPIPETGDGMGLFVFAGLALISMLGMAVMRKREQN